jgi:hypothetical protein
MLLEMDRVEVIAAVNDGLGCTELSFPTTTTTLEQVADEAARYGLPSAAHPVVLMVASVFTPEVIDALKAKLKAELTEHGAGHNEHVKPILGSYLRSRRGRHFGDSVDKHFLCR